ncbi:mCG146360 [Mus musculus]|nr:mCG146360 [Mus musculus]
MEKASHGQKCLKLFSISGFMWMPLIHLDLSLVQGDKSGSICILLHADRQLNQHHLLKMRSFFPLDDFVFFVKDQVTIDEVKNCSSHLSEELS